VYSERKRSSEILTSSSASSYPCGGEPESVSTRRARDCVGDGGAGVPCPGPSRGWSSRRARGASPPLRGCRPSFPPPCWATVAEVVGWRSRWVGDAGDGGLAGAVMGVFGVFERAAMQRQPQAGLQKITATGRCCTVAIDVPRDTRTHWGWG